MDRAIFCAVVALLLTGHVATAAIQDDNKQQSNPVSSLAASAAGDAQKASSPCAKQCFESAKKLGFERVATDSMACFLPHNGKRMSTYDCCDKAELLFGSRGSLANCFCCPEFAKAMLDAVPFAKIGTTHKDYLEKMNLCRVPIAGQGSCSARLAKESMFVAASPAQQLEPKPLIKQLSLTGFYPLVGFDPRFDTGVLAAQGAAAIANGTMTRITVAGASELYNDYLTGFVMWIEKDTPRYNTPIMAKLPPLPDQFKDDVAWVANLRRGPYPDLIRNRPAAYAPKNTDPLQNGQISNLPPGPAFANKVPGFTSGH